MQLTKTHKIIISIITLAILLGLYIAFDRKSQEGSRDLKGIDSGIATTSDSAGQVNGDGYTITQVPYTEATAPKPIPSLTRTLCPINNTTNEMRCEPVSPEVQKVIETKVSELRQRLIKDPTLIADWFDLGIYEKMVGDFDGAIESWKYASRLSPTDYISLGNLGNLYAYYLKDNAQSETYYKQAISKGPTQSYLYIQLAEVYRDIFKDNAKALALIDSGLVKIPNDPSLLEFKSSLIK